MQHANLHHLQPDLTETGHRALEVLRRKAWETLLDLGLTEEEIVAYYGIEPGRPAFLPVMETRLAS